MGALRACSALQRSKWPGKAARQFALSLAQSFPGGRFVWSPFVLRLATHCELRAFAPGCGGTHSAQFLAQRASPHAEVSSPAFPSHFPLARTLYAIRIGATWPSKLGQVFLYRWECKKLRRGRLEKKTRKIIRHLIFRSSKVKDELLWN